MGLFGWSKKEKMLQAEVERLNGLLLPEQQEIEKLNQQIGSMQTIISDLDDVVKKAPEKSRN